MIPLSDYERRFLGQHNSATSPQKPINNQASGGSPQITPTKYRQDGGDRYIPIRPQNANEWATRFASIATSSADAPNQFKRPSSSSQLSLLSSHRISPSSANHHLSSSSSPTNNSNSNSNNLNNNQQQQQQQSTSATSSPVNNTISNSASDDNRNDSLAHRALLRNELLQDNIDDVRCDYDGMDGSIVAAESQINNGLFKYMIKPNKYGDASTSGLMNNKNKTINIKRNLYGYGCGILSDNSERLLKSPRKPQRKVPKNPYKVLDAPDLQDDFYLNLVDWSSLNMLSVGLNTCVYLWSAFNSQVVKLCDLSSENDTVTSVQWADKGDLLAVGTNKGITQIWDIHTQKKLHQLNGHTSRIGCLAWNMDLICSGSRDRLILMRDIRESSQYQERRFNAHRQEVCGLRWSPDRQYLASGGNDNQLLVWSLRKNDPFQVYTDHNAAVKALAWSPHHHGLLVSGGGTADRCLRFWNTLTGQSLQSIDTGSQVCNVAWSKHTSELVSTHGYSYNQVIIWKYPSLQPVTKLTGHQYRVLYLAMSPDGESIVTGAGDETLRFWHVFSKSSHQKTIRSKLNLLSSIR